MITLSLLHPVHKNPVQHWTFEEESVIRIGRSTENDVVLYSAVVSRHHVELRQTPSGWEIVNLGTNGTYLEGKRISQVAAQDGTVIRLARSGPNVQISIGSGSSETVKALMRLRAEAAAAQQAKEKNTTAKELETEKQTHPVAETLTPSRLDEEKPNSKNWTYMEEEE